MLKFKVWDTENKIFLNPEKLVMRLDCGAIFDRENDEELHHVEVLRYSFIIDKNGRELYENEIFSITMSDGSKIYKIIRFIPEAYSFCIANTYCYENQSIWAWSNIRIDWVSERKNIIEYVGNIYENPELLEGK